MTEPVRDTLTEIPTDAQTSPETVNDNQPAGAFQALGIDESYLYRLAKQSIEKPTEIQEKAIPIVFEGRDIVARAPTGSGKSAAFLLPILHRIWEDQSKIVLEPGAPRALVLVPTRELAAQLGRMARALQPPKTTQPCEITGGVPYPPQFRMLDRPQPIMIATPGRLIDLMDDQRISLSLLEMLVLDEADRMLEMGFTEALDQVLAAAPKECQKLLFSATVPRWVEKAANRFLNNPANVEVGSRHGNTPQIEQGVYYCGSERKRDVLKTLLEDEALTKVVVFVNSKAKADELEKDLRKSGVRATSLHGDHNQSTRRKALAKFRDDEVRVLVASDVAARGVDLPAVSHVINFDLPRELETYVHRIGRTGRAQQEGVAIALCDTFEMSMIRLIERKQNIEMVVLADELPPKAKRKKDKGAKHLRPEWSNKRQPRRAEEERSDRAKDSGFDPDDEARRAERGDGRPSRPNARRVGGARPAADRSAPSRPGRKPRASNADTRTDRPYSRDDRPASRDDRPRNRDVRHGGGSRERREERGSFRRDDRQDSRPARRPSRAVEADGFGRKDRGPRPGKPDWKDHPARAARSEGPDASRRERSRDDVSETRAPRGKAPGRTDRSAHAASGPAAGGRAHHAKPGANKGAKKGAKKGARPGAKGFAGGHRATSASDGPVRPKRQVRGSYIDDALDRVFGRENDEG